MFPCGPLDGPYSGRLTHSVNALCITELLDRAYPPREKRAAISLHDERNHDGLWHLGSDLKALPQPIVIPFIMRRNVRQRSGAMEEFHRALLTLHLTSDVFMQHLIRYEGAFGLHHRT